MILTRYISYLTTFLICSLLPGSGDVELDSTTIPLKQAGRLFLIEASIDGQIGNFVFDTGSTSLVLNKTYFRNYARSGRSAGGISGTNSPVEHTRVRQLDFAGISLYNLNADIVSLGHIENRRGIRILGLLGMDVLKNFEMIIDFRAQTLVLHRINRKGDKINSEVEVFTPDLLCKVLSRNDIMYIKADVGGKTLDFCLDTGAESNILCSSCRKGILSTVNISRRTSLTGIGGQSADVFFGSMSDFNLNNTRFEPMQAIITSLAALSATYDFPIDGVLGYDFFAKGTISINLVKRKLGIKFYNSPKQ